MELALKLEVHWSNESPRLLCVNDKDGDAVVVEFDDDDDDDLLQSGYVELCGDDLVVKIFGEENKVPDVSRYRIEQEDCCVPHDGRCRICDDRYLIPHCNLTNQDISRYDISGETLQQRLAEQQDIGNIVLLLESPHKDEYNNGDIADPKKPACGNTGLKIDQYLGGVLKDIIGELNKEGLSVAEHIATGCHVVISNPIQYQTSLHAIHKQRLKGDWKTLRDNVWRTLWRVEHIRQCFRARLGCYYPKVIINACTGNRTKRDSLKRHVENFILREFQDVRPVYIGHPSFWQVPRNRKPTLINPQPNHNPDNT